MEFKIMESTDSTSVAYDFPDLKTYREWLHKLKGKPVIKGNDWYRPTAQEHFDNQPTGLGWVKFDVLTYQNELGTMLAEMDGFRRMQLTHKLTATAIRHIANQDVYFRFISGNFEIEICEREQMSSGNMYQGFLFDNYYLKEVQL
jgi:hypothetical protein